MGTEISGFVECRASHLHEEGRVSAWRVAIDLFLLNITRNYDAFGCLFGVRNYADFRPLAADRGLPADASETVRAELDKLAQWPEQAYGTTWITWAELKAVDWDEPAEKTDSRLHEYRQAGVAVLVAVGGVVLRDEVDVGQHVAHLPVRMSVGARRIPVRSTRSRRWRRSGSVADLHGPRP